MSLVSTAIIAGATAGLSDVAKGAIQDLYKALKSLVLAKTSDVKFDEIDADPENAENRNEIARKLDPFDLENDPEIRLAAEKLIKKVLSESVPLDKGALISIKELKADKGVFLEDIDLDRRLFEAEKVETKGEFRAKTIRAGTEKKTIDEPAIKIGHLEAGVANFIQNTIFAIPKTARIVIVGIFACVVAIFFMIAVSNYFTNARKQEKFDEAVKGIPTSDYQSSVNYVLSVIPGSVRRTRDSDHWKRFSYSWNKHISRLENSLEPIAKGLADGTMRRGKNAEWLCEQIQNLLSSHYSTYRRVSGITGIGLNESGGDSSFIEVFGPVVSVPKPNNMEYIYASVCDGNLNNIKNPPDTRTDQEKVADRIANLEAFLSELEELKSINIEEELERAKVAFLNKYAGYLVSQGMWKSDAIQEAKQELRQVMSGGGANYFISGMNDIFDRIRYYQNLSQRDLDAEIDKIRSKISEIRSQN